MSKFCVSPINGDSYTVEAEDITFERGGVVFWEPYVRVMSGGETMDDMRPSLFISSAVLAKVSRISVEKEV